MVDGEQSGRVSLRSNQPPPRRYGRDRENGSSPEEKGRRKRVLEGRPDIVVE